MILFRYIIREHLLPFLYSLAVIIFILVMNWAVQLLDMLINKGLEPGVVLELFLIQLGWIMALAIPMAILVATLMTFGAMSADNEITAVKASGRSLTSLIVPVMVSGCVLAVMLVFFNNMILPDANHRAANLSSDISRKRPAAFLEPGVLVRDYQNYVLYVDKVNPRSGLLRGIRVFSDAPGQDPSTTVADSGYVSMTADQQYLRLTLFDGESHSVKRDSVQQYFRSRFAKQVVLIRNVDSRLQRTNSDYRGDREKSSQVMLTEVNQYKKNHEQYEKEFRAGFDSTRAATVRFMRSMDSTAIALASEPRDSAKHADTGRSAAAVKPAAGAATAIRHRVPNRAAGALNKTKFVHSKDSTARKEPSVAGAAVRHDSTAVKDTLAPDSINSFSRWLASMKGAASAALATVRGQSQTTMRVSRQIRNEELRINQAMVEVHKKYAIPVTCIVFVLIGAPLGIMARRGGIAVGASYSIFFFIVFWACYIGGEFMADRLYIQPWVAMWSGNIIIGVASGFLLWRMVRENTVISFEWLIKLRQSVAALFQRRRQSSRLVRRGSSALRFIANIPYFMVRVITGILPSYLLRKFFGYLLGIMAGLVVIFIAVDYVSNLKRFEMASAYNIALYYWYYLPWFITMVLPIAILLATMFAVGALAKNSELTAMRGSGISIFQLTLPLLVVGLGLAVFGFWYAEQQLPKANFKRRDLNDKMIEGRYKASIGAPPEYKEYRRDFYYFGDRHTVYYFREFRTHPQKAAGARRETFAGSTIVQRVEAASMVWHDSAWYFVKGSKRVFDHDSVTIASFDTLRDTVLTVTPDVMVVRIKSKEEMSYWELADFIEKVRRQGEKVNVHLADLYFKIALPFMNFIVVLLGISVVARMGRKGGAMLFGIGISVAFTYWIISRFGLAFAQNGQMSPMLGAWLGNIIFLALGILMYRRAVQ